MSLVPRNVGSRNTRGTLLLLLAVALLSYFLLRPGKPAPPPEVQLQNGVRIQLLGVTPAQTPFIPGGSWKLWLRDKLPRFVPFRPGLVATYTCGGNSNDLSIYLAFYGAGSSNGGFSFNQIGYAPVDKSGFVYERNSSYCTYTEPGRHVVGFTLSSFPRREEKFDVQIFGEGDAPVAQFLVKNPLPRSFPSWQSQPLPQTATNGLVTLTLRGLKTRPDRRYPNVSCDYRVQSADPAWEHAKARYSTFEDPTGNRGSWLSPSEPVWRVKTDVYRMRQQDFAANETIRVQNIPVPREGAHSPINVREELGGVAVSLVMVAGASYLVNSNGVWEFHPNPQRQRGHSTSSYSTHTVEQRWIADTTLFIDAVGMQGADDLFFDVRDELGREVTARTSGWSATGPTRRYTASLELTPGATNLGIAIALNRPIPFSFFVSPTNAIPQP